MVERLVLATPKGWGVNALRIFIGLLMAILGGASTLTGPIVGAAIITLVKNVVSTYVERWNTLLGAIFVLAIIFMPYGLVPGCRQFWQRIRKKRQPTNTGKPEAAA